MTFRDMDSSFDLPPETDPREIVCWKVFRGIAACTRGVLHHLLLQTMDWGYEWFDAGKVMCLTLSTSPS